MTADMNGEFVLHPEILRRDGRPEFAVLPYEEYLALRRYLEDLEDLLELRRARASEVSESRVSLDEVLSEFGVQREGP